MLAKTKLAYNIVKTGNIGKKTVSLDRIARTYVGIRIYRVVHF